MLYNQIVEGRTLDEVWLKYYELMVDNIEKQESRDGEVISEVINAITVIEDPTRCIMTNTTRKLSMRYAVGELLWYLSGNRSLSEIQKYTKAWDRMSDDGKNVNSNYGYCIKEKFGFNQYEYVKHKLMSDSNSRQAIIHIKDANNKDSLDVNCTICLQFFIRGNKLYMTTYMRSNDLWLGYPYDIFQFTCLQVLLSMELGIELGSYTHIAGSLHLYERDYKKSLANKLVANRG